MQKENKRFRRIKVNKDNLLEINKEISWDFKLKNRNHINPNISYTEDVLGEKFLKALTLIYGKHDDIGDMDFSYFIADTKNKVSFAVYFGPSGSAYGGNKTHIDEASLIRKLIPKVHDSLAAFDAYIQQVIETQIESK